MSIVFEDDVLRVATIKNAVVAAWFDAPNVKQMRELRSRSREVKGRHPGGTALINAIVSGTPRFSSEVRAEAAEQTREGIHNLGAAHVVLVGGFIGTAVRAFLNTSILLGRAKNPTRVFGDVPTAARWVQGQLAAGPVRDWTVPELIELVEGAIRR